MSMAARFDRNGERWRTVAAWAGPVAFAAALAVLSFARLGHYPLWDDEALTALGARGIVETGDTSALIGHNLVAFRGGILLHELKDRAQPPLSPALTAVAFLLGGESAFTARLPFAVCGFLTAILLLGFAHRHGAPARALVILAMAILGNVSFFLYARQCRYYAVVMLLSVVVAHAYLRHRFRGWHAVVAGLAHAAVFASHSIAWCALVACLVIDYLVVGHRERPVRLRDALIVAGGLALCVPVAVIWNPLVTEFGRYPARNGLVDRAILWLWHWRDLDRCEFMSGGLMLASIVVAVVRRDLWLARGLLACTVLVTVTCVLSPQPVAMTSVADVRYLTTLMPLAMVVAVRCIWLLARGSLPVMLLIAACAFGTNLLNGGPLLWCGARSTLWAYLGELRDPPEDPWTPTIVWLRENVGERESVWVVPDYMVYPLMFHVPAPQYAWQVPEAVGQFAGIDEVHVQGRVPPRFIVAFGPIVQQVRGLLGRWQEAGVAYEAAARLPVHWEPAYRPELFWRTFVTIPPIEGGHDGVHVLRRVR